jgi:hypothetical protein
MLRYEIPDFKLEKRIIDRRFEQMMAESVEFQTGVNAGKDISIRYLHKMFDCAVLTMGARQPRDLAVAGRGYENILFAMDYLAGQGHSSTSTMQSSKAAQMRCLWLQSHTLTRFLATGSSIDGLPETPECFCRWRVGNALLSYWIYIGRSVKTVSPSGIFCSIRSAMASKLAVCGTLEVTFVKIRLPENTMPHSN